VLPAVLRKFGILELTPKLALHIDSRADLVTSDDEIELRVLAIVASNIIINRIKSLNKFSSLKINSLVLDYYLWTKGKDPEFRAIERHYTKDTFFFIKINLTDFLFIQSFFVLFLIVYLSSLE